MKKIDVQWLLVLSTIIVIGLVERKDKYYEIFHVEIIVERLRWQILYYSHEFRFLFYS